MPAPEEKRFKHLYLEPFNRQMKIYQLLRRFKNFKLSRMSEYASTFNFYCSLHLAFLNGLFNKDFFKKLLQFMVPKGRLELPRGNPH